MNMLISEQLIGKPFMVKVREYFSVWIVENMCNRSLVIDQPRYFYLI